MSVYCSIAHPRLFLKALSALTIRRDCWATAAFTPCALILRVEGNDLSSTATAELPRSLFGDYHVDDEVRFAIHVPNLIDALLLLGPALLFSPATRVVLAYAAADAKLLVELSDTSAGAEGRTVQSTMITRPIPSNVLDLHFDDGVVAAEATIQGETVREIIFDLLASHCSHVVVTMDAQHGVQLLDEGNMSARHTYLCRAGGNGHHPSSTSLAHGSGGCSSSSGHSARMSALLPLHCDALLSLHAGQPGESDWARHAKTARTDDSHGEAAQSTWCAAEGGSHAGVGAPVPKGDVIRRASVARTCVSTRHLALACGVHGSTGVTALGGGTRSWMRQGGGSGALGASTQTLHDPFMAMMGVSSTTGGSLHALSSMPVTAGAGSVLNTFELLTVQLNSRGQVSVVHTEQDKSIRVSVSVVISPLHMVA